MNLTQAKLFINPDSGRGKGQRVSAKLIALLKKKGLTNEAYFSKSAQDLQQAILNACLHEYKTIIIAGGDGSIHAAVNGIMRSEKQDVSLGIIPIGTGNDLIKALGIPKDLHQACDYLSNASPHKIDIGHIETHEQHSAYFINNIGAGFDGSVGLTAAKIPFIRGIAVYVLALIWHLFKGIPNPFVKAKIDDEAYEQVMTLVAISNGTTYGGSFKIAPDAEYDDGKLDCVLAPARGRLGVIPLLLQLMRAKHLSNPKVVFKQCETFSLTSDKPIVVIADGELISAECSSFNVKILKQQFSLLLKPK